MQFIQCVGLFRTTMQIRTIQGLDAGILINCDTIIYAGNEKNENKLERST